MKKVMSGLMIFSVSMMLGIMPQEAQAVEVSAGADVVSSYVWRGITFNDEGVIQPWADLAFDNGVGFNVWGNFDLGDFNDTLEEGNFQEIDLTLSYAVPIEVVDLSIGLIDYIFPQGGSDSQTLEYYISVAYEVMEGFTVGYDFYHDIDEVNDVYSNLNFSFDLGVWPLEGKIPDKWSLGAGFSIGFAGKEFSETYGGTDSGAFEWDISVNTAYQWSENVEIGGFLTVVGNVDSDALIDQATDLYGGGSFAYSF